MDDLDRVITWTLGWGLVLTGCLSLLSGHPEPFAGALFVAVFVLPLWKALQWWG